MIGPVAMISGAGRGIGRAAAVQLHEAGYSVVLISRTAAEIEETLRLCDGQGIAMSADVSQPEQLDPVFQEVEQKWGRLDALVHCAGLAPVRPIEQMSVAEWRAVIETNLSAAFYLCRGAWPMFRRQGGGVVVNISSAAARDPFPGFAAYGAAKAGVNLVGLSAAREGQAIGVRVHTIAPAATETSMFRALMTPEQYPAEKTMSPDDVAQVIVQCVRGDLRYASGEVIYLHKTL